MQPKQKGHYVDTDFQNIGHLANQLFNGQTKNLDSPLKNSEPSSKNSVITGTQQLAEDQPSKTGTRLSVTGSAKLPSHQPGQEVIVGHTSTRYSTKNDVKKLFVRFQAAWGHKWTSNFDDTDDTSRKIIEAEWWDTIKQYTIEGVVVAFRKAKHEFVWPPSLSEFQQLLQVVDPVYAHIYRNQRLEKEAKAYAKPAWMSEQQADPKVASVALNKMRKILMANR